MWRKRARGAIFTPDCVGRGWSWERGWGGPAKGVRYSAAARPTARQSGWPGDVQPSVLHVDEKLIGSWALSSQREREREQSAFNVSECFHYKTISLRVFASIRHKNWAVASAKERGVAGVLYVQTEVMWSLVAEIHEAEGSRLTWCFWGVTEWMTNFSRTNLRQVVKPRPSPEQDGVWSFCHRWLGGRYVISSSNHKRHNYVDLNMKGRQEAEKGGCIEWKCNLQSTEMFSDQRVSELPQRLSGQGYGMVLLLYVRKYATLMFFKNEFMK